MSRTCLIALLIVCAPAAAQPVEIGPFVGERSENLENVAPLPGLIEEEVDVFDGDVTFVSLINDTTIHLWSGSCLSGNCANPRSGVFLIGATTAQAIVFHTPVTRFGSYFTNNSLSNDATATFFDAGGNEIGEDVIEVPTAGSGWFWNGWESAIPIGRIEIHSNGVLQGFIWLDDLEMDTARACAADTDGDGAVDVDDLVNVVLDFGCTSPPGPCPGDVNADGVVNVDDLVEVIFAWGPCS